MDRDDPFPKDAIIALPEGSKRPEVFFERSYGVLGSGYRQAAELIWTHCRKLGTERPRPDFLVFPIVFLMHHAIELQLKDIIHYCLAIGALIFTELSRQTVPNSHDLSNLLRVAEQCWEELGLDEAPIRDHQAKKFVHEVQRFTRGNEAVRYPSLSKGEQSFPYTCVVHVPNAFERFELLWRDLTGTVGYLDNRVENIHESHHV